MTGLENQLQDMLTVRENRLLISNDYAPYFMFVGMFDKDVLN